MSDRKSGIENCDIRSEKNFARWIWRHYRLLTIFLVFALFAVTYREEDGFPFGFIPGVVLCGSVFVWSHNLLLEYAEKATLDIQTPIAIDHHLAPQPDYSKILMLCAVLGVIAAFTSPFIRRFLGMP